MTIRYQALDRAAAHWVLALLLAACRRVRCCRAGVAMAEGAMGKFPLPRRQVLFLVPVACLFLPLSTTKELYVCRFRLSGAETSLCQAESRYGTGNESVLPQKSVASGKRALDVVDGSAVPGAEVVQESPPKAVTRQSKGEAVRIAVVRDTWFSNVGREADMNLGGATRLKLKSIQEMSLVDIDPSPLKGRIINAATLHVRLSGNEILHRVTVSSFAAEWVEGTSPNYAPQNGSSCHNARQHPNVPWAYPGSDLCAVILGQGGTIWRMADASPPDANRWQRIAVDPLVVALRVAGVSHGFLLFDDTGSEWTRNGDQFHLRRFPNRFVHSRESGPANAPYFTIYLGEPDGQAPQVPEGLEVETAQLPAGEARISWITPEDRGKAGTVGFFVDLGGKPVPRYLIPSARKAGERVTMRLRDLGLRPGQKVELAVRAVDGAGNVGAAATLAFTVSSKARATLPEAGPKPFTEAAALPRLGAAAVAIVDPLDKIHPVTGEMIPPQKGAYLSANHLWSAKDKLVRLFAARNEFVGFQILFQGKVDGVQASVRFEKAGGVKTSFFRYHHVKSSRGPLPDPLVPLQGSFSVPTPGENIIAQKWGSLLCEIYVPHEIEPGEYAGILTLSAGQQRLALRLALNVWNFTLPDFLSFLPEMNCYRLPANERAFYRLGHLHRTVVNRVPYSQSGNIPKGLAPVWNGTQWDWAQWDQRFGPYFDGSAFSDLPRKSVPLDCFYLPLHENWPTPMEGNYNGDYWADRAFPASYRQAFVDASAEFAKHFHAKGWHHTLFQCYLNNKNSFKERGWSRGSSPWILDEPTNFQDYWALRYFASAFQEGVNKARGQGGGQAKLVFRIDISRPQWERNTLEGLVDYYVVAGGAFRRYHRLVLDRTEAFSMITLDYGSSNAIEDSNVQPVGWCLDSWSLGSDGVVPWQTIGNDDSWQNADALSLFYPGGPAGQEEPIPSIRLKAFCRGQQDVEYLTLLTEVLGEPRWAVGQQVREALRLVGERRDTGFTGGEDAGTMHYAKLLPQEVWTLRTRVGEIISRAAPKPRRQLREFRTPPRDPSELAPGYVSVGKVPD